MPITVDQFEAQFNKLQAAFGTVKSPKIFEEWFKEFEHEDYFTFLTAMKRSQYGQRFPTWEVFKAELRNSQGVTVKEAYAGCGHCKAGVVLFRDLNRNGQVSDQAGNCANCSENKQPDMVNVRRQKLHLDSMGNYRTQRALKKDLEDGVRVEEPHKSFPESGRVADVVRDVFGSDDPGKERKRYGSIKREEEREAREVHGY
tara:strand:- start:6028 stop:6630 length:603 start_codon:yes stop_codon:yes gene_type:complete